MAYNKNYRLERDSGNSDDSGEYIDFGDSGVTVDYGVTGNYCQLK